MSEPLQNDNSAGRAAATDPPHGYRGHVAYLFAYDIAYDLIQDPETLLGLTLERFSVGPSKRGPREPLFYRPLMVTLPPVERTIKGSGQTVTLVRTVKLFGVGAISITARVPFAVPRGEDLVGYHDLQFEDETLLEHVERLAEDIRKELLPFSYRPVSQLKNEEAYTVFCIESPVAGLDGTPISAGRWLQQRQREVAALLTQEQSPENLSDQEAAESTGLFLSYYDSDLTVIDWDAAVVIDQATAGQKNFEEILHVMELANVQLAELEAYDGLLDDALGRAYADIRMGWIKRHRRRTGASAVRRGGTTLTGLREIRVDLARLSDELWNTTKFFGDWHLARIYQYLSSRFHLGDWQRVVDDKLQTLDSLYQLLKQDRTNSLMMILEVSIVVLFVIDLIILALTIK